VSIFVTFAAELELAAVTVTAHVAVLPLDVLTVIVAVPAALAVTFPVVETVAMFALEVVQVSVLLSVVLLGMMVAVSWRDSPTFKDALVGDSLTSVMDAPVAGIERVSFTPHVEQVRVSTPATVLVAAWVTTQAPYLCPWAAIERFSVPLQVEQVRVSVPAAVQVAAWVTVQLPYAWPFAAIERFSVPLQVEQVRVSVPAAVQVAALVTTQAPYAWPLAGIERVSATLHLPETQVRVSVPVAVQVAALVTVQAEKVCAFLTYVNSAHPDVPAVFLAQT